MNCSTATILVKIETLQLIQKTNHPDSDRWKEASHQLQPLFEEMKKRTSETKGQMNDVAKAIHSMKPVQPSMTEKNAVVEKKWHQWQQTHQSFHVFLQNFHIYMCYLDNDL